MLSSLLQRKGFHGEHSKLQNNYIAKKQLLFVTGSGNVTWHQKPSATKVLTCSIKQHACIHIQKLFSVLYSVRAAPATFYYYYYYYLLTSF